MNPVLLLIAVATAVLAVSVLVSVGTDLRRPDVESGNTWVSLGSFFYGLLLLLVVFAGQRGSPLRLRSADVTWVLTSAHGPQLTVLSSGLSSSGTALVGSVVAAGTASLMTGRSPLLGITSGVTIASLVLLLRTVSLFFHYTGLHLSARIRRFCAWGLTLVALSWVMSFALFLMDVEIPLMGRASVFSVFVDPIRSVLAPETGLSWVLVPVTIVSILMLSTVVANSAQLVEPAVRESDLARQISLAFSSDTPASALSAQGLRTGLQSWRRWPRSPVAAVLTSHWVQLRRRTRAVIGRVAVILIISGATVAASHMVPVGLGIGFLIVLAAAPSSSQPITADLDRQYLPLSGISLPRTVAIAALANGAFEWLSIVPGFSIILGFYYGSVVAVVAFLPVVLIVSIMCSFAGLAARAYSETRLGHIIVAVLLVIVPLIVSVSSALVYGDVRDWGTACVSIGGTCLVAAALYAGLATSAEEGAGVRHGRG